MYIECDVDAHSEEYAVKLAGILEFITNRLLLIENETETEDFALLKLTNFQIEVESMDW